MGSSLGRSGSCISQIVEQAGSLLGRQFLQLRRERVNFRLPHEIKFVGQQRWRRAPENRRNWYLKSQRLPEAGQHLRRTQRVAAYRKKVVGPTHHLTA